MYAVASIALFLVALFSKEVISAETMFVVSGLFGIAGAISYVGLQLKNK